MSEAWYKQFDNEIDTKKLIEEKKEAENNSGEYPEIKPGLYEVELEHCELKQSKKGLPMVSASFRIVAGDCKNSLIFYNQVIHKGLGLHLNNEFFRSMKVLPKEEIDFVNFAQYGPLMDSMVGACKNFSFKLKYGQKGQYNTYEILEVYENVPAEENVNVSEEDIPF